jgi:hypothetical protein
MRPKHYTKELKPLPGPPGARSIIKVPFVFSTYRPSDNVGGLNMDE